MEDEEREEGATPPFAKGRCLYVNASQKGRTELSKTENVPTSLRMHRLPGKKPPHRASVS